MTRASGVKPSLYFGGGFLLLLALCSIHLTQGQAGYSVQVLWAEVWTEGRVQDIVLGLRLPRVTIGVLSGAALAAAGALLQTLTKNPLASSGTLGISAGAYFFVVVAMIFFPGLLGKFPLFVSLLGAALSSALVIGLAGRAMEPVRVALTGMIVAMLFSSFTGALQLLFENETNGLFLWGSGTLVQLDWSGVRFAAPLLALGFATALLLGRQLDTLKLGEDVASSLGQPVLRVKAAAWAAAILLSAATVSVVGPIGFVGLIAPHLVRMMGIREHRPLLLHSMLWGAVLLVGADVVARWIQPDQEIPVGAMTALIGGPWLMYLAYKTGSRQARGEQRLGGHTVALPYGWLVAILTTLSVGTLVVSLSFGGGIFLTPQDWLAGGLAEPFVWNFRVPRILVAFAVGMLLAASGMLLQAVLRNPLADPGVIGITSGGGASAMLFLLLFPAASIAWLPLAAAAGSALAVGAILLVTWRAQWQPIMLALMGVAVSAVGSAIIQVAVVKSKLTVAPALAWLAGTTYARGWEELGIVAVAALVGVPIALLLVRELDTLSFGDDVAKGLGLKVSPTRLGAIALAVVMGGVSVAVVGTIGFIGLLAPHAARRMVGFAHGRMIPVCLLLGGLLLVGADFLGRFVLSPKEIPAGLVVALLGTPYLLYLLRKT
ncbi:Fe(3+)-hydroxamate ABC transporter permease FhuB [Paenibacillus sp. TRM 82003]|nr:Fe(3+)-hydroxamate ABC transporter permease FhuB [Paenibacillus sp. TRM 82003]